MIAVSDNFFVSFITDEFITIFVKLFCKNGNCFYPQIEKNCKMVEHCRNDVSGSNSDIHRPGDIAIYK